MAVPPVLTVDEVMGVLEMFIPVALSFGTMSKRHTGMPSYLLSNGFLRTEGKFPSILVDFPNILINATVPVILINVASVLLSVKYSGVYIIDLGQKYYCMYK